MRRSALSLLGIILFVGCKGASGPPAATAGPAPAVDGSARPAARRVPVASNAIPLAPDKDANGFPLVTADKVEMRRLLAAKNFEALDAALDRWEKAYEGDAIFELAMLDAFTAFEDPDPRMRPPIVAWTEAKPSSHFAHLARASYELASGLESRGTKYAKETSDTRFASMRAAFDRAAKETVAALDIHPDCLTAYYVQLQGLVRT